MRIASGTIDQVIYFVAVDAIDLTTRETGLSGFTVYRSRNGGAATAFTTPTVTEVSAANMPGVYKLLLDEDMTIDAGDETQEYCIHIAHASMAPVTRSFELYRPKITVGNALGVDAGGNVAGSVNQVITGVNIANGGIGEEAFVAGAITQNVLSTSAANEIRDAIVQHTLTDTGAGTFGRALLWLSGTFSGDGVFDANALENAPSAGLSQPYVNHDPEPAFTLKVSSRSDGLYKATRPGPIWLRPGALTNRYVWIDMSPLFGDRKVLTVGSGTVTGGSATMTVSGEGPRDHYAVVQLEGTATASDVMTVKLLVTMVGGAVEEVVFDVKVFAQ